MAAMKSDQRRGNNPSKFNVSVVMQQAPSKSQWRENNWEVVSLSYDKAHAYLEGDETVYSVPIPAELYRWSEKKQASLESVVFSHPRYLTSYVVLPCENCFIARRSMSVMVWLTTMRISLVLRSWAM
jgi:hypothetical protein